MVFGQDSGGQDWSVPYLYKIMEGVIHERGAPN